MPDANEGVRRETNRFDLGKPHETLTLYHGRRGEGAVPARVVVSYAISLALCGFAIVRVVGFAAADRQAPSKA